ncbi:leucyl aminopeptidase family protein [Arenibacterium sp. CAU 1754]
MTLKFAAPSKTATPIHIIESVALEDWLSGQDDAVSTWVTANGFSGKLGQALLVPGPDGQVRMALVGYETAEARARGRYALAAAAAKLPEGVYRIDSGLPDSLLETECLGWLLSEYRFDRYRRKTAKKVRLVAPDGIDAGKVETIAAGEVLLRDLINTPTADMGPDDLESAAAELAKLHGAKFSSVVGEELLKQNFPMIHAVGRASATPPRLIEMNWGSEGPRLTLVGKGVCFDTGGLDLKPRAGMALMKKDMGGAANVLGLAHMIMALKLPLQLRVLVPAVENSVAGNAFRPGDILTSRKGLTVEVNNTDAEGRLVLADALALADESKPDLLISMATLTGAARVAVGSDIAPFFTDDDGAATALSAAGGRIDDPVWRLPFHAPYESKLDPKIADLDNAPSGGFAGAITAAMFLRRFAGQSRYMHFDIYGWTSVPGPARPKGGCGQGIRALLEAMPDLLKL